MQVRLQRCAFNYRWGNCSTKRQRQLTWWNNSSILQPELRDQASKAVSPLPFNWNKSLLFVFPWLHLANGVCFIAWHKIPNLYFPGDPVVKTHLLLKGTWIQSLVHKDSTCCRTPKPTCHDYWAHIPEFGCATRAAFLHLNEKLVHHS